jgi:hypothetical protein
VIVLGLHSKAQNRKAALSGGLPSSWRSRFISDGIKPAYFFRQLWNVASLIPALRQTSPTAVPSSACHRTKAICASVNFDRFMVLPRPTARISHAAKLEFSSNLRSRKPEAGHLYFHQQGLDTTTPSGWAMYRMCDVFAELERAMIRPDRAFREAPAKER